MSDQRPMTKDELMKDIDRTWPALNAALDKLTESQMADIRDAEGWAVKDHLTHLAAWERSMVFMLQGKSRHQGLGVSEKLYLEGNDDPINAAIQHLHRDVTPEEAQAQLEDIHGQLMGLLERMTDEDLLKPYSHYLPNEQQNSDDSPIFFRIHGNTAGHFEEHLGWIESLVSKDNT